MLGGSLVLKESGMATVQTSSGTYILPQQEAVGLLETDVAWQQEQAALQAASDREAGARWQMFFIVSGMVIVLVTTCLVVAWFWPSIQQRQTETRTYRRYLTGRGPAPAFLLAHDRGSLAAYDIESPLPPPADEWQYGWADTAPGQQAVARLERRL